MGAITIPISNAAWPASAYAEFSVDDNWQLGTVNVTVTSDVGDFAASFVIDQSGYDTEAVVTNIAKQLRNNITNNFPNDSGPVNVETRQNPADGSWALIFDSRDGKGALTFAIATAEIV